MEPHASKPAAPRSRRAKIIGAVLALGVMGGLGWLAWDLTHQAPAQGGPGGPGAGGPGGPGGGRFGGRGGGGASTVGVATAEKADIPVVVDALGTVTAAAVATVRPQVSGILTHVLFKEGQAVKAGQVLAQIDPRPFENALMQSSGQLQRDEAQLDNARLTLERFRTLLAQDSIARQEVDTQAALVKQIEGTVMTDKAAQNTAKLNLSYTKVTAPINGRVGLRTIDIGNLVGSSDPNGIAVITQLSPIDVEFSVPQDLVPDLQAQVTQGARLPAQALDRGRTMTIEAGLFAALDNQVDVQTGTVKAKARFANAKLGLFPSQFVNIRLEMRTIKDAVVVPVTALRHGATGDYVYVLNERTVAVRPVVRGQATVDKVEIKSGVKAGEQVITEGADRLKDGGKVMLPGDKPQMPGAGGGKRGGRGGDGAASGAGGAGGPGGEGGGRRRGGAGGAGSAGGAGGEGAPSAGSAAASLPVGGAAASGAASGEGRRHRGEGAGSWQGASGAASGEGGERRHKRRDGAAASAAAQ